MKIYAGGSALPRPKCRMQIGTDKRTKGSVETNMRRMKQAGTILAVAVTICGLAACGKGGKESKTAGGVTQEAENQDSVWNSGWGTEPGDEKDDGQEAEPEDEKDTETDVDLDEGENPKQDAEADDGQGAEQDAGEGTGAEDDRDAPTVEDYAFSSNDWKTLEFALDGAVYTFPLTCSDIEAAGFLIGEDYRHEVLEANYYTLSVNAENEAGERISVRFKNFGEGDRELQDCDVYGIGFEQSKWRDVNPDVMLCNGVTFGMTAEEVKALMGEPDYDYESEGDDYTSESMEYYVTGNSYENEIEFYFWNGVLTEIDILNKD